MKNKSSVKTITICALFTALISIGAFIRIPISLVPITLQTFFVSLAGITLGKKRATISCGLYLLLGLIGLPVFTQGGGLGYIFNPTFGYLIGFVSGAFIMGIISGSSTSYKRLFIAVFSGMAVIYLIGTIYYYIITVFYLGNSLAPLPLLTACVFISLPSDIITNILAVFIGKRLKKHIL